MEILHPRIEAYLATRAPHGDPILSEMEGRAEREEFPIVGPQVGRLLMLLARAIRARRIFEVGSGFGYSALWFAKALPRGGRVTLTEYSADHSRAARDYLSRAGQGPKARCLVGDGLELLRRARESFDLIFLDADKRQYPAAFRAGLPKLRAGGLFVADNLLWFGGVLDPRPDADTRGILEFTRLIHQTPGLLSRIVPLRDGVSVSLKLRYANTP